LDEVKKISQSGGPTKVPQLKVVAGIPCFNTKPFIENMVSKTKKYVDQVIVVDDGSRDSTAEAARKAGALVISHGTNKGYGEAIKSCFEAAKINDADVLVILDGDGQHEPDETQKLIEPILSQEADLVIGSRFLEPAQRALIPRYRKFGIGVITWLFNLGSRTKVSDAQSGFRAYNKKIFNNLSLFEKGMSISIETLEKARRNGAIIKEVPISCFYTPSTLHLKAIRHGLGVAFSVVRIRFKNTLFEKANKNERA
jgi:glycosyltransferase involved in cell wall biosynthesis